jgi:pimeloyl-ACP methyl ester carboxylesterase
MTVPMRHLIVLLPGTMGSVLQKDGHDVWALSGQALGSFLLSAGASLQALRMHGDDWQRDDLGDGIRGTRIIEDLHSVPGLAEHAGYSVILRRICEQFDLEAGQVQAPQDDVNFYPFPYDWRRDCRATARMLKAFVDKQLPRWRAASGAADAQVILIGHSLGGLVSRYYLEALDGWRDCRALISVGSPHRGAIGALDVLSNGFKNLFLDLSDIVRSFPSAYQILPTYAVVNVDGHFVRPAETDAIPNLDRERARLARAEFLDHTRVAAVANQSVPGYQQRTIPWIGTRHDTWQSAAMQGGKLVASYDPPDGLDPMLANGDGTVPRVSAVPADLDGQGLERFVVERHAWLTNNEMALEPLLDTLTQLAAHGSGVLYGAPEFPHPAVNVKLEPLHLAGEPVHIGLRLMNAGDRPQALNVQVDPVGQAGSRVVQSAPVNTQQSTDVALEKLAPGLYQLTVAAPVSGPLAPAPVHGVFEIADPATNQ